MVVIPGQKCWLKGKKLSNTLKSIKRQKQFRKKKEKSSFCGIIEKFPSRTCLKEFRCFQKIQQKSELNLPKSQKGK